MAHYQLDHFSTPKHTACQEICVLASGVALTENLGSLLRLADAFGVKHVYFTAPKNNITQKKVKRVSRSTVNTVSWSSDVIPLDCIANLKENGFNIVALELTSQSQSLRTLTLSQNKKVCLVVGNEKSGISADVLNQVDHAVFIPMYGENSSMNVAQASAIALYQLSQTV